MTDSLNSFLNTTALGNKVSAYLIALGIFLAIFLVLRFLLVILKSRLHAFSKRTKTQIDDVLSSILSGIHPFQYGSIALFIALQTLTLHPVLNKVITIGFIALLTYMVIHAISMLLTVLLRRTINNERYANNQSVTDNLLVLSKALLWIFGSFIILANAGVDITSLVTGLGIGGIAVALALQNILSDLFSSFAIYVDKPFLVGDFIIIGDKMGVVEKIGIKTTRIRALQGEEIVFSNKQLAEAEIQNFKKMRERRVVFTFGVVYETPFEQLQAIPALLRTIIEGQEKTRFDRAHFARFDDSALTFEVVYYVLSDDYNTYMDIQQQINFEIVTALLERKVSMAHPTRILYLQQVASRA